jgi:hypothetical protein
MLVVAFIAATRVQFCIVHGLDRLARNRADDVSIAPQNSEFAEEEIAGRPSCLR